MSSNAPLHPCSLLRHTVVALDWPVKIVHVKTSTIMIVMLAAGTTPARVVILAADDRHD
jgi:hypothetical protein